MFFCLCVLFILLGVSGLPFTITRVKKKKGPVTLDLLLSKDNSNLLDDLFFFYNRTQSISDLLSAYTILILSKKGSHHNRLE